MKANEVDILIIPGYTGSDEDHWQSRWERKLSTARRVEQIEWSKPVFDNWVEQLIREVKKAEKPVVLVAHALGVPTAIHAVPHLGGKICGGFFVAPPDVENPDIRPRCFMTFGPYLREPLPFPCVVIASCNDHFCNFEKAKALAKDWHALFLNAGEAGPINTKSGHGPWPEGLLVFSQFLAKL